MHFFGVFRCIHRRYYLTHRLTFSTQKYLRNLAPEPTILASLPRDVFGRTARRPARPPPRSLSSRSSHPPCARHLLAALSMRRSCRDLRRAEPLMPSSSASSYWEACFGWTRLGRGGCVRLFLALSSVCFSRYYLLLKRGAW